MVDIDKLEALEKTWEMVKDLKPLRPHEVEHFTRCCFRDSPGQPKGWVREYMPLDIGGWYDGGDCGRNHDPARVF